MIKYIVCLFSCAVLIFSQSLQDKQLVKQKLNDLGISSDQAQKIIDNKSVNIPLDEKIINDKPSEIDIENINEDLSVIINILFSTQYPIDIFDLTK